MIKNKLKIEAHSIIGAGEHNVSAHDMLRIIHGMLAPKHLRPRHKKQVSLKEALSRVVAEEIRAEYDSPLFDESLRDGFAITEDLGPFHDEKIVLDLVGNTGAGDELDTFLKRNETWKVMTGGVIPGNCARVIPQEHCLVNGNTITIDSKMLSGSHFIKKRGSERKKGSLVASDGDVISPALLTKIVDSGRGSVNVYRRPQVCFCCTGKELVEGDEIPGSAQKRSSNQYLLAALLEQHGCIVHDYGIVADEVQAVNDFFQFSLEKKFDLVLTTGGTGGGTYDLVENGFLDSGGGLICNSIDMLPGKSLIVGEKDETLYVGLPGPPHSVHTVFLEIIAPLLLTMKGVKENVSSRIVAIANEDIITKTRGKLLVKEGVLTFEDGFCKVRKASKDDNSNCNILIAPGRDVVTSGQKVEVHMRSIV